MYGNVGGEANVAIGFCASKAGTSSRHNVGIGFRALDSSTSNGNIAIGYQAGYNQSSGFSNTMIGCRAGYNQSTGDHLVLLGNQAGENTRGDNTTAIGSCALYYSVTGTNSVAVGTLAGQFLANGMGQLKHPDNSTYLGALTRGNSHLDENTTVIGYCACSCGDNTISLGNANVTDTYVRGNIIACATDARIKAEATAGNHPGFELLEAGNRCWVMYNDPDNSDALTFKDSADRVVIKGGNVGIGTTVPNCILTVGGTISAQGYISCCGTSTSKVVCGTSCVRGAYVCSTGDICASSGVVYGGGCVCGACVTDGYSCFDGGGNVCASYYVCAGSCVLASGDICATGGTVCGYYICGSYGYFGTVSKSSGSFNIDHPLESKKDTHKLVHSFIEGPQADNIYSGVVQLTSGSATINIDNCANMTEGTFVALNRCIRTFANNESNWDLVRSRVSGNIVTVESCVSDSTADVSWMVIGERQDPHMYDPKNPMTNNQGQVIVEPVKPALSGEE